ncbi:TKL protein kinase [Saprolegnia diclina VS20]|uniref:TKL protein kinase n=1 Tax=Saprolegnia diclina (strain VS20) TaxID=1156394 RepID=T0R6G5_SAPDV|nr:TKL protein kinase [Saprolegnia diclina VS20]EQC42040.1 TKL protein kinase [Saprolegnia diclina VS20]|eukprot:XP_008604609.1 TKL protein kinase [Saprolegnia diclina VS20]
MQHRRRIAVLLLLIVWTAVAAALDGSLDSKLPIVCNATFPCYDSIRERCLAGDVVQHDGRGRPFCSAFAARCQNKTLCYDSSLACPCGGDRPCLYDSTGACEPQSSACSATSRSILYSYCVNNSAAAISLTPSPTSWSPSSVVGFDLSNSFDKAASSVSTMFIIMGVVIVLIIIAVVICACKRKDTSITIPGLSGPTTNAAAYNQPGLVPAAQYHMQIPTQQAYQQGQQAYQQGQQEYQQASMYQQQQQAYQPPTTQYIPVVQPISSRSHASSTNTSAVSGASADFDVSDLDMYRISHAQLAIIKPIAQGAYGEVLLASYQGMRVAVKKLLPNDNARVELPKFIAEIKLLAKMESPYIVQFIGASWLRPSDIMLVTEFLEAGDLRNYLQGTSTGSVPWHQKLQLAYDILQGLVYLHTLEHKVIHRDLKSRNVLLTDDVHAKLTDFGIAREMDDATMTAGIGTYRWMAPEVLQEGHYAESADMFSFGVILSELDTHQLPYADKVNSSGRPYTDTAIMAKVMTGELRPSFSGSCPRWYRDLGSCCMALKPEDRPTAMEASYTVQVEMRNSFQS